MKTYSLKILLEGIPIFLNCIYFRYETTYYSAKLADDVVVERDRVREERTSYPKKSGFHFTSP